MCWELWNCQMQKKKFEEELRSSPLATCGIILSEDT